MSSPRTIIAFGSGPGIGNTTISTFLSHTFTHAILLARSPTNLATSASSLARAHPNAKIDSLTLDLSDLSSIPDVLDKIDELTRDAPVEVVFFNAARIKPTGAILDVPVEEIGEDLRTTTLSLHLIAQHFLPRLHTLAQTDSQRKPALLVTSSHLPWAPEPALLSLSVAKAAQRTMVQAYHKAYEGTGVQVGLVSVEGQVEDGKQKLNKGNIAGVVWGFWEGRERGVDVRVQE